MTHWQETEINLLKNATINETFQKTENKSIFALSESALRFYGQCKREVHVGVQSNTLIPGCNIKLTWMCYQVADTVLEEVGMVLYPLIHPP